MGYDGIIVSFHRCYSEYVDFQRWIKQMPFINAFRLDSFLIDLNDKVHHRYLTFSYLASPNTCCKRRRIAAKATQNLIARIGGDQGRDGRD